ncbi:MAG: hypothetical protein ACLTJW_12915 [Blautia caecimuris]
MRMARIHLLGGQAIPSSVESRETEDRSRMPRIHTLQGSGGSCMR